MSARSPLRWSAPKPLVGARVLEKLLRRQLAIDSPESQLVAAMLTQAIADCLNRNPHERALARRFIEGDRRDLEIWCDLAGLNIEFVQLIARKAGYLVPEELLWAKPLIQSGTRQRNASRSQEAVRAGL